MDQKDLTQRGVPHEKTRPGPAKRSVKMRLPLRLKQFFWEYDFSKLNWEEDRDLVIKRILTRGDWDSVRWLREQLGPSGLRSCLIEQQGRGIDAQQLRFWELILKLPHRTVSRWIEANDGSWARRTNG